MLYLKIDDGRGKLGKSQELHVDLLFGWREPKEV
jgi:hypothetical protein